MCWINDKGAEMSVTTPTERKIDPRVKRTRALIQQSFAGLLENQSFKSITIQNITDRAEINRATFYAHFPDKFALLNETISQKFRHELENRTLGSCHYSADNLLALILTVCEFTTQSRKHCKSTDSQFEVLVETQVKLQVQELLEYWLSLTGSEIDPGIAATAASWAIYGLALRWSRDKIIPKLSAEQYVEQVFPLIAANLRVEQSA
jgi:AcrR family transcriptional regulator